MTFFFADPCRDLSLTSCSNCDLLLTSAVPEFDLSTSQIRRTWTNVQLTLLFIYFLNWPLIWPLTLFWARPLNAQTPRPSLDKVRPCEFPPPPINLAKFFCSLSAWFTQTTAPGPTTTKCAVFVQACREWRGGGGRGWCVQQLTKIQSSETLLIPRECNQLIKSWLKCQFSSTMLTILANGLRAFVQLWILSFVRAFVINNLLIRADIGENRTWPLIALNI